LIHSSSPMKGMPDYQSPRTFSGAKMLPAARGLRPLVCAAPSEEVPGCADWRSAAGEWLLWFAPGGGPPDFCEVPCPPVVIGRCLAGRWVPPGKGFLCRFGFSLG
jgi:hypothetical protein